MHGWLTKDSIRTQMPPCSAFGTKRCLWTPYSFKVKCRHYIIYVSKPFLSSFYFFVESWVRPALLLCWPPTDVHVGLFWLVHHSQEDSPLFRFSFSVTVFLTVSLIYVWMHNLHIPKKNTYLNNSEMQKHKRSHAKFLFKMWLKRFRNMRLNCFSNEILAHTQKTQEFWCSFVRNLVFLY